MKTPFKRNQKAKPAASPDGQMTLTEHLAELRMRIIRATLAVIVGFVICLAFYSPILRFLKEPFDEVCRSSVKFQCLEANGKAALNFFSPLDGVSTRIRLASYGGFLLALPVILWQLWRFIVPGLHAKERRYAIPFLLSSVFLFLLGGFIAFWTLPKALEFLFSFAGEETRPMLGVAEYVRLVALMVFAFGIGLEFPVLLVFLMLAGVLSYRTLLKNWRFAIVGIVALAAIITPSGDPVSLAGLSVPMLILYFVAIVIGRSIQLRREAAEAAGSG